MLKLENINKSFDGVQILKNINITIENPGIYFLIGKNGSGKTTLLRIIKGNLEPDSGEISLQINNNKLTYKDISYVPVTGNVFNNITVYEHLKLICDDEYLINNILDKLDLQSIKQSKGKNLSSGEKQRLGIAMAIIEDNNFVLLDEPTSHLDNERTKIVLDYLKELSNNKVIIISTHYMKNIDEYGNYFIKLEDGNCFLEENKINNNKLVFTNKNRKFDSKIIFKLLNWKLQYIFILFSMLMLCFLVIFLNVNNISAKDIQKKVFSLADYNSIIIPDSEEPFDIIDYFSKNKGDNDSLLQKDLDSLGLKNCNDLYINYEFLGSSRDVISLQETYFYAITNEYNGYKLGLNEIVVSDYLYDYFRTYNDVEGTYILDKFENTKLYIHDIIKTNYFELIKNHTLKPYFDTSVTPPKVMYKEAYKLDGKYISENNYVYKTIYMNYETFLELENQYIKKYLLEYNNSFKVYSDEKLAWGRAPENDNEVVVDSRMLSKITDGKYYNNGINHNYPDEPIDLTITIGNRYYFRNSVKVVGVTLSFVDCAYFYCNESIENFCYNNAVRFNTYFIDKENINDINFKLLEENGLTLGNDLTYIYLNTRNKIVNFQKVCILYILSSFLLVLFIFSFGVLLKDVAKKNTYSLLQEKCIPNEILLNEIKKDTLINLIFSVLTFVISYIIIYFAGVLTLNKGFVGDLNCTIIPFNVLYVIIFSLFILVLYGVSYYLSLRKIKRWR